MILSLVHFHAAIQEQNPTTRDGSPIPSPTPNAIRSAVLSPLLGGESVVAGTEEPVLAAPLYEE